MQRVPISQRGGEVIEPLLSSQWFVKMDGMAAKGLDAVRSGQTQILPERFEKTCVPRCRDAAAAAAAAPPSSHPLPPSLPPLDPRQRVRGRFQLAREHTGLVHLAPALVGPPDPRVVRVSEGRIQKQCRRRRRKKQREMDRRTERRTSFGTSTKTPGNEGRHIGERRGRPRHVRSRRPVV